MKTYLRKIAIVTAAIVCASFAGASLTGADESFVQTDWSGGASAVPAAHPANAAGWTKYSSKEANIDIAVPGLVKMLPDPFVVTDDTDADFSKGTRSNVQIADTGTAATLGISTTYQDPFCSELGQWTNMPFSPTMGAASPLVRAGNYIYSIWIGGDTNKTLFRWSMADEKWEMMADIPLSTGVGAALGYDGNDIIYALCGGNRKEFFAYQISTNTWYAKQNIPGVVGAGGSLVGVAGTGRLYAFCGSGSSVFYRYTAPGQITQAGSWSAVESAPFGVSNGASLIYPGSGNFIYASAGNGSTAFAKFDLNASSNAWSSLANCPSGLSWYSDIVYPGTGDHLYAWKGDTRWFGRYHIGSDIWESSSYPASPIRNIELPSLPFSISSRMYLYDQIGDGTELRLLSNHSYSSTYRYFPATKRWREESITRRGSTWGTSSIYVASQNAIYYIPGDGYKEFYKYYLDFYAAPSNTAVAHQWEKLSDISFAGNSSGVYVGGSLAYKQGDNYIYCLQGYYQNGFSRYNLTSKAWEQRAPLPQKAYWGGHIVAAGDYIYASGGYNSDTGGYTSSFYRYDPDANSWTTISSNPYGAFNPGACMVYPEGSDYIYMLRVNSRTEFMRYRISTNSWERRANLPDMFVGYGGKMVYSPSENAIYYLNSHEWSYYSGFCKYSIATNSWQVLAYPPFQGYYTSLCGSDTKLYCMGNSDTTGLQTYSFASGQWNNQVVSAPYSSGRFTYGNVVVKGEDAYFFLNNRSGYAWKYSLSQKRWSNLIKLPFWTSGLGHKAVYPGAGDYIYVSEGNMNKNFWRYNTVTGAWEQRSSCPYLFSRGSRIIGDAGGIYVCPGEYNSSSFLFFQDDETGGSWIGLNNMLESIGNEGNGSCLISSGGSKGIYMLRQNGTVKFTKYNIDSQTWSYLADAPWAISDYCYLFYPGTGNFLYCLKGAGRDFAKFDLTTNTWTILAESSISVSGNPGGYYPGTGDILYFYLGQNHGIGANFNRYSISEDRWDEPIQCPATMYNGGQICPMPSGEELMYLPGNGSTAAYKYNVNNAVWYTLNPAPTGLTWDARAIYPGAGDCLYVTRGEGTYDMWQYSISSDAWTTLAVPPYSFSSGSAIAYFKDIAASREYIFALRGGSTTTFLRYSIEDNQWVERATTPTSVTRGANLIYPGSGDELFAVPGGGSVAFWKYNASINLWSTLSPLPMANSGGVLFSPGFGDYLYFFVSYNYDYSYGTNYFYRYSITHDSWEMLAILPVALRGQAAAAYPGTGDFIYLTGGYGTTLLMKYLLFSSGSFISDIKEIGNNSGFGAITWEDNAQGQVDVKVRTGQSADLSDASDWTSASKVSKNSDLSQYVSVKDKDEYLQYRLRFFCYDLDQRPRIDRLSLNYQKFPLSRELVSSQFNTTAGANRLRNLSWDPILPSGTDLRFQLRTAPDAGGAPGAWGPWLGPAGIQLVTYAFNNAVEYANTSEVVISNGTAKLSKVLADYLYRQRIVVDNSAGGQPYTNCTIKIDISDANINFWEHVADDGSDIRFVDSDGKTPLGYRVLGFSKTKRSASAWVTVPSVPSGAAKDIYLLYGKSTAASASDPTLAESLIGTDFYAFMFSFFEIISTDAPNRVYIDKLDASGQVIASTFRDFTAVGEKIRYSDTSLTMYRVRGDKPVAIFSSSVEPASYYDDDWYTVCGNDLWLWCPSNNYDGDVIITAYNDDTQVKITDYGARDDNQTIQMDKGIFWFGWNKIDSRGEVWHIEATKPVTVMAGLINHEDAVEQIRSPDMKEFYFYCPNSYVTLTAFEDNTSIIIDNLDGTTGDYSGMLNKGRSYKHIPNPPSGALTARWYVKADKPVCVVAEDLNGVKSSVFTSADTLVSVGKEYYINTAQMRYLRLVSFEDGGNSITIDDDLGTATTYVSLGARGSSSSVDTGPSQYRSLHIVGTKKFGVYLYGGSSGEAITPVFKPTDFNHLMPTNLVAQEDSAASVNPQLAGWQYKETLFVDNTANDSSLADFQVAIDIDSSHKGFWEHCRADGADVRFLDSDEATLLKHYIELFSPTDKKARFWVKIPALSNTAKKTLFMYYGKADAAEVSDGHQVFEFFDDFNDGLDLWDAQYCTLTTVSAILGMDSQVFNIPAGTNSVATAITIPSGVIASRTYDWSWELYWADGSLVQAQDAEQPFTLRNSLLSMTAGPHMAKSITASPAVAVATAAWNSSVATINTTAPHGLIPDVAVTSAAWGGNIATINTASGHSLSAGKSVVIANMTPGEYNGNYVVLSVTDGDTFTVAKPLASGSLVEGSGGRVQSVGSQRVRISGVTPGAYNGWFPVLSVVDSDTFTIALAIADPGAGSGGQVALGQLVPDLGGTFTNNETYDFENVRYRFSFTDVDTGSSFSSIDSMSFTIPKQSTTTFSGIPLSMPVLTPGHLYSWSWELLDENSDELFSSSSAPAALFNISCGFGISSGPVLPAAPYAGGTAREVSAAFFNTSGIELNNLVWRFTLTDTSQGGRQVAKISHNGYIQAKTTMSPEFNITTQVTWQTANKTGQHFIGISDPNAKGATSQGNNAYLAGYNVLIWSNGSYYDESGNGYNSWEGVRTPYTATSWNTEKLTWAPHDPLHGKTGKVVFELASGDKLTYNAGFVAGPNLSIKPTVRSAKDAIYVDKIFVYKSATVKPYVGFVFLEIPNPMGMDVYYTTNPVVQPVLGVFYDGTITDFTETITTPANTAVKYQVSSDGYNWHWWSGAAWEKVTGGYSQTNSGSDIRNHLAQYVALFPRGEFWYRAFLHSEDGINTPQLDNAVITTTTDPTYYLSPSGNTINLLHQDTVSDQWFQYKAILSSVGAETPVLNSVSADYVEAYVKVLTPNGGETFNVGQQFGITWQSQAINGTTGRVKLEYSVDGGQAFKPLAANLVDTGSHTWTLPDDPSQAALIKISSEDFPGVFDVSDGSFRILSLQILSPNGGEIWESTKQHVITWQATGVVSNNLYIQYSLDDGVTWSKVANQVGNAVSRYTWPAVPSVSSDAVRIKIFDDTNETTRARIVDTSDTAFAIVPVPAITILAPEGGELWKYGLNKTISWKTNQSQFSATVDIDFSRDGFLNDTQTVAHGVSTGAPSGAAAPNADLFGSCDWSVPDAASESVQIRIKEVTVPEGRDTANAVQALSQAFAIIEPSIAITAPVEGDVWISGDTQRLSWTSDGAVSDDLVIAYSIDQGANWTVIREHEGNGGNIDWQIPVEAVSDSVQVRIIDNTRDQTRAVSPSFRILGYPTIELVQPNGGEFLIMGEDYAIKWNSWGNKLKPGGSDYDAAMTISYSLDGGTTWQVEAQQQMNDGIYTWSVPQLQEENDRGLIKIEDSNDPLIGDVSATAFTISNPSITITSPNGGESMFATGNYSITWSGRGAISNALRIDCSSDNGVSWILVAEGEVNDGIYPWKAADFNSSQVRVRITDATRTVVTDISDAPFTIVPPSVTISSPNGGEEWVIGTEHEITWSSVGREIGAIRDNLTFQYSVNGGTAWQTFFMGELNDGSCMWTVPDALSATCRVKVFDATRPATQDVSDADFKIVLPYIQLLVPNGMESWPIGTSQEISWKSVGTISDNLRLEYSKDNFGTATTIASGIARGSANPDGTYTGSYTWPSVNDDYATTVKVKVLDADRQQILDVSDNYFIIANPIIKVLRPNGGELFTVGDSEIVKWQNTGSVGSPLKLEYSTDNFASVVETVRSDIVNAAPYELNWTVPDSVSAGVRVRVTDTSRPVVWDKSDGDFTILPIPVITISHPNGGEIWHVGAPQNITWGDNGGLVSNNLTFQYSTDGGTNWKPLSSGVANTGSYVWTIPDEVSNTAMVKITDSLRQTTTDVSDNVFRIADPVIAIVAPNGGEVWAVGDHATVQWTTIGGVSDSLVMEFSPDGGATYYFQATVANTGSYSWTVPDYVTSNAIFRIKDAMRPVTTDVSDKSFIVNPLPTITVTSPNGGEVLVLGDLSDVTWTWTGLSISNNLYVRISNDDFSNSQVVASGVPNDGRYHWTIPNSTLTGSTLKISITDGNRTTITDRSDGYFRIRGGFTISSPNGEEKWLAKSPQTIGWQTKGTIPLVNLEYSSDDGMNWQTISSGVSNTGIASWTLPNIKSASCRVRVSDPNDNTVSDASDSVFSIVYATVKFNVLDFDTLNHLSDFTVSEPQTSWQDSAINSPVTRTDMYPYGTYTTFFTKTNYIDNSATWTPPKQGTDVYVVTVNVENSASAQVTWDAILTYSYSPADDSISAVGSLQRKGKLVGTREEERIRMGQAVLTVYEPDGTTLRKVLSSPSPNTSGMYTFTYVNTAFESGKVYPATLTIMYNEQAYTSSANIDVGAEKLQYEFFTKTATQLAESVSSIKSTVETSASQTAEVVQTVREQLTSKMSDLETNVKGHVETVMSNVESTVTSKVEETRAMTESGFRSAILNTEGTVKQGDTLLVRYRTYAGLAPVIDVYNEKNLQKITKGLMKEKADGIYEYAVKFSSSWGKGAHTIICSEPSRGTIDALIVDVVDSDIESISGQVAAILGSTTGLSEMKDVGASMTNMFSMIESAISKIGKDVVSEVKVDMQSGTAMTAVYDQLTTVSKQLKEMAGDTSSMVLDKLYNVSEEKKDDISYLKNKTQELKAVMELNQKLIENMANKPVMQTWYEYK